MNLKNLLMMEEKKVGVAEEAEEVGEVGEEKEAEEERIKF